MTLNVKAMPGRLLVDMLPVDSSAILVGLETLKRLGLQAVDKKHHFQHVTRKGRVTSIGRGVSHEIQVGDVVVFRGDAGFSMDYDPENDKLDESHQRWLREDDCMAVDIQEVAA